MTCSVPPRPAAAYYEGSVDLPALIRNWVVTYAGNFFGSLVFVPGRRW